MCSVADIRLAVGAFTTRMPSSVAAATSTLSTPIPARPTTLRRLPALKQLGGRLEEAAHHEGVEVRQDLGQPGFLFRRELMDLHSGLLEQGRGRRDRACPRSGSGAQPSPNS